MPLKRGRLPYAFVMIEKLSGSDPMKTKLLNKEEIKTKMMELTSAMTKAETEQAIIKIEDLFKKIGINKALRGQTP
jgi:hypothetical protein